jgi:hypothetical protein
VTLAGEVLRQFDAGGSDLNRLSSGQYELCVAAQREHILTAYGYLSGGPEGKAAQVPGGRSAKSDIVGPVVVMLAIFAILISLALSLL